MLLGRRDRAIQKLTLYARKVDIHPGIETLQHYIDTHTLWLSHRAKMTNVEFKRYSWPEPAVSQLEKRDPRGPAKPRDAWNHAIKALTYFLVCKFGLYRASEGSATVSPRDIKERSRRIREARFRS
jgi:hypothetical protein